MPDPVPPKRAAIDPATWWRWPPLDAYLHGRAPRFWRPLGPGIGYSPIKRRGKSGASAILLLVAPGAALPHHGHAGTEMNVILEGGYTDMQGRFDVGDFSANDVDIRHKPTAEPDEYCVALVALAGPLQFGGGAVRLLQAIAGI
jgi:putative transcriptional regulator